jgi:hypothetical protein
LSQNQGVVGRMARNANGNANTAAGRNRQICAY